MSKQEMLDLLMLLSALESWLFANGKTLPDYLHEKLNRCVDVLAKTLIDDEPNTKA